MQTWNGRRSNVLGTKAAISCDQPLAAYAGAKVLDGGGTAADAAVAASAVLSVIQPSTCGLGGDAWVLYYDSKTKRIHCINGHGRTPAAFTRSTMERLGFAETVPPLHHALCTAVPGAPAAFCLLHQSFGNGKLTLRHLFEPAIRHACDGFPVSEVNAFLWRQGQQSIVNAKFDLDRVFMSPDRCTTPEAGQVFRVPDMARTLESIADGGPDAFYTGRIARAIVDCQQKNGGLISLGDLAAHKPEFQEPIKIGYRSKALEGSEFHIYETPPTSQGIVTLEALQLLSRIDHPKNYDKSLDHYYHALIESLKYGFADLSGLTYRYENELPPSFDYLLSESHAIERAKLFNIDRASILNRSMFFEQSTNPISSDRRKIDGDTTYFTVIDRYGNACSVVYSLFTGFGTGYVPEGCGFTLNNRAYDAWRAQHRRFVPNVRPFSTLMAGMITKAETDDLAAVFGCMGGQNQPQGHLQILMNLLEFGHSPQQALDRPRVRIDFDHATLESVLHYEDGIAQSIIDNLRSKGHRITSAGPTTHFDRNLFGRGHVITRGAWWDVGGNFQNDAAAVLWAGCDPRSDGIAIAF